MTLNYFQIAALMLGAVVFYIIIERVFSRVVNPKKHPRLPSTCEAIDRIEKEGYAALFYMPGSEVRENSKLWDALEVLKSSGHIIVDQSGHLVGQASKVRMDAQEKADVLRSKFKIVKDSGETE